MNPAHADASAPDVSAPDVSARKAALRAVVLARRDAVTEAERRHFAQRLARVGVDLLAASPRGSVAGYWPTRGEPDCRPMLSALEAQGFRMFLPAVVGGAATPLAFRLYRSGDPLVRGPIGAIPEPPAVRETAAPDILFVPCAAFDRSGRRIGFGGGYYDATLAALRARKPVTAVLLAFACQEIDEAPAEPHDQTLDAVITERETFMCTQTGKALDAAPLHR